jgi:hypothetical protein
MLEDRSVNLFKLEVDVPTLVQFNQEIADRIAGDNAEALARSTADGIIQGNLNTHTGTGISTAHGGLLNVESQISNGAIGFHKLTPTPASQGDFSSHVGDGSIHFTLGYGLGQASPGQHAGQHVVGGADALGGTLGVSITGSANYASYAGWAYYAG